MSVKIKLSNYLIVTLTLKRIKPDDYERRIF